MKLGIKLFCMGALLYATAAQASVDKRECRKEFRENVGVCKSERRANKHQCRVEARAARNDCFSSGGDVRNCLKQVRMEKRGCRADVRAAGRECVGEARQAKKDCLTGDQGSSCQLQCDETRTLGIAQCEADFDPGVCAGNPDCEAFIQNEQNLCKQQVEVNYQSCISACN